MIYKKQNVERVANTPEDVKKLVAAGFEPVGEKHQAKNLVVDASPVEAASVSEDKPTRGRRRKK